MEWSTVGLAAGLLTSAGFVPQIIRSYRTKKVHDVSLVQPAILLIGMMLWLVYGIGLDDKAIIAANGASLLLNGILIVLKIRYDH